MRICLANALILAVRRAGPQARFALAQRLVGPLLAAMEAWREPSSHVRAALLQARTPTSDFSPNPELRARTCASVGSGCVRAVQ